jgi:hypothetical protein
MPHKRNPVLSENLTGLARIVRAAVVPALENVALWHERDISHSSTERIILPDTCILLDYMLAVMTDVVRGMNVFPERMRENLEMTQGLVFSQKVLLALIDAGEAIDAAFARIGQIVTTQLLFAVLAVASIAAFPYTAYRYLKDIPENEPRRVWTYPGVIIGAFLYFWLRWTFSLQAVMLEKHHNWSALDASAEAVRGSWWRTLLYVLAIVLVAIVPATLVASGAIYLPVLASAIIIAGVTALVIPFVIIGQTFLYFDLKARRLTDASTD